MGRRFALIGSGAVSSGGKSIVVLQSATSIRPALYDLIFGTSGTPADNALTNVLQRFTSPPTGTSSTPTALDPDDPASAVTGVQNATTGTYTSGEVLLSISCNQRSTQRWVAAPGGEIKAPATANNGLGFQSTHASYTGNLEATMHYDE